MTSDTIVLDELLVHLARLGRLARLLTGDATAADDLLADAVARALPKLRAGGVADPPAYVRQVLVNLARRRWRRQRLALGRDRHALDWLATARDAEAGVDDRDAVLRALSRLPARRRAVVVLRFYDDLTEPAIAEVLGIAVGTVKSHLSRALQQLRTELGTETRP